MYINVWLEDAKKSNDYKSRLLAIHPRGEKVDMEEIAGGLCITIGKATMILPQKPDLIEAKEGF